MSSWDIIPVRAASAGHKRPIEDSISLTNAWRESPRSSGRELCRLSSRCTAEGRAATELSRDSALARRRSEVPLIHLALRRDQAENAPRQRQDQPRAPTCRKRLIWDSLPRGLAWRQDLGEGQVDRPCHVLAAAPALRQGGHCPRTRPLSYIANLIGA